jgi:S1-C subfamily serine protease
MKHARIFGIGLLAFQTFLCGAFCQSFNSAEITKRIAPAVVLVTGVTDDGKVLGSGFIISSDGKIATNLHVIQTLRSGGVQLASGERFDSFSVLAFDERKDVAIIKIAGFDLPLLTLGNSNTTQVGEPVLIMGSPLGLQGSVTTGVVSSMRDDPFGGGFKMIQTDASVNPGNSGGPLVNQKGEVVGIIRYKIGGTENLNFAIPINYLRGMMDSTPTAMTLDELRVKLAKRTDVFQQGGAFPTRWKSLASGTTKMVRRDGDHIYVETVLPEAAKQAGCFSLADLQKQGDIYSGTSKFTCVCQYQKKRFTGRIDLLTNRYSDDERIDITKVSPTRIEGIYNAHPQDSRFDCENRTYSKPAAPQPFAWIPE